MFAKENMSYEAITLPDKAGLTDVEMQKSAEEYRERMASRHSIRHFTDRPVPREIIESCLMTAGNAPSGANHQPWFFAAVSDQSLKARIREEAEIEERKFYDGGGSDEWIKALEPIGTNADKPHLTTAPWQIVIFAQRWGEFDDGTRYKNYYVPESVGIATGFLISALHTAGLSCLTHTPNPMKFLNAALDRPDSEKPVMILTVGHPAKDATVPAVAKYKKPLDQIARFY